MMRNTHWLPHRYGYDSIDHMDNQCLADIIQDMGFVPCPCRIISIMTKINRKLGYRSAHACDCHPCECPVRDRLPGCPYLNKCARPIQSGWSKLEDNGCISARSMELGIEANLADPEVGWDTKASYLKKYMPLFVTSFSQTGMITQSQDPGCPHGPFFHGEYEKVCCRQ